MVEGVIDASANGANEGAGGSRGGIVGSANGRGPAFGLAGGIVTADRANGGGGGGGMCGPGGRGGTGGAAAGGLGGTAVAAGTALPRVTGLLRVFVFAYVVGQTLVADAYKLANETPNIVSDLLLGGVLSATLVPLFTSFMGGEDDEPDEHATNVVITVATTLLVALTVVKSHGKARPKRPSRSSVAA